jgi:nucleotide-binding universal stress UspA family protein
MSFNCKLSVEELGLITKILVGADGSENSQKALDYALEVADKFSASVHILNVFQPPPEFGYQNNVFQQSPASGYPPESVEYQSSIGTFIKDLRAMHESVLSKAVDRAAKLKPALKITAELTEGDAPSQIVETAANGEFDLIVIGHRGNSRIQELFLGSTSERVAHLARCAVLIIK